MKIRIYTFVIAFCVFHFINMQAWSCMIGYYTDGRTYDTNPAAIIEATGYTPIYVSDISTYDVTQLDVLMINVASNDGPSESLLSRLTHLEFWVRTGGKLIFHDRSSDNSLLIDASSTSLIQNTNTLIYLAPYGTGNNALILGDEESEEDNITTGTLQNTNGFALASTLPSTAVKYLASADDNSKIAAFLYPLGFGYIYYSGIPLDYYFRQTGTSQPGENYRTIYTPNLLKMICMLNIQPEPEPQEGDTCLTAQDLTKLTSPYAATTTGYLPDFYSYCGNYAPDRIFYIDVPAGYQIQIQQLSNTYDSQHSMRYGGDCPGTYKIVCVNDSDTRVETWLNLTGHSERVYWINGAYYRDEHGDFTLWWELTKPDINANWIGDADNDWNNPENWDIKHKPNEIVGVTISANALNYPQLDGQLIVNLESNDTTYKCRQLTIEQGGRITTTDKVINHGIIQINGGIWNHQDNHNDSIVLKNESVLEINDGTLVCGDSNSHEQTDLIVEAGGKLVVNSGTLEITDRLVISDGASFSVVSGHIEVGTYTGTIADSSHVAFEIAGWHSNFYLDQATIVIKRSGDMSNPGLWFHENANISLNNGRFVFSNASDHIQTLYARFNGHSIPNISVQMLDNSNELIFCDSQSTIGQLTITKGTFRLNGTHLSLNGGHSPAIVVGNDAGILLVDDGTLSITQNQASFTALDVQTGGQVEIQTNGILDRQVSIADNYTNVIHIHTDGEFLLNGGTVNIDNQHAEYPWGTTIDSGGLFKMTSGTFNNDAAIHCYGTLRFQGGTFNLASQTDETQSVFNIYDGARIYAQQAVFDGFSQASGLEGIHVYENATIGDTPNDDLNDFDGCTFQNWHQQGQALTVENTESFTMTSPIFMNTEGKTIAKESSGVISVTAYDGNRSGETFDAEPEGCTMNYVNWDNTVRISATNNTGTAIYPANGQTRYYASNTQIEISGMAENGQSILWIAAPTGSTHPEYGESASESITLLKNANITWYSGTAGRWIGLKNTKWDEPSNWADHKVPTMNTPVSIDSGCTYYPILDQSLSINSDKGVYKCRSISLSSDITFTTNANVYCYSLINIQQASWIHSGNTIDSFQIDAGGKLTLNNAAFISSGLAMINDGQFEVIESAVDLSYGIHNENGAIEILNSTLYFGKDSNLDDISFKVEGNTMLKGSNSRLIFQGDAGESNPCIQFHPEAQIVLENTDIIFQLHENQDTMHADFAGKTVDNVYIQMPKETQTFKLINRSAEMNHLFVDNGIFDVNGMTLSLLGDATALKIGNKNQSKALLNMASGKIEVNNSQTDIALHIIENGHFLISGGEFERNLEKAESDKMIWIESGVFEQTGGTVFIDNQKKDYHCDVFIDPQGIFKLSGGTFQNDGRINCSGFMDLDGGTIKMSSNSNIINGTIHIEDGRIHAQNTRFQGTGVLVYENASVGTDSGNDNDDFDNCTFEDWSGSALTFSNSESFTITNPSFSNTNTNITKKTNGFIEVVGVSTDTHFGEAFDSDPEGSTINKINWENTRTLSAESATALAISPASNEIVYYASETTAHATGELLTGSVINWAITPEMSSSPSNGDSTSAEFTIKENAKITWYSGVPGHWTGRTSEEWTNPENWSDHRVPNDKFDVVISGNNPHYPVLNEPLYINNSGTIQCRSLSIESGATLTVQSTVMAYSIIEIYGNWIQETDSDNAIQLFDNSQLLLNNASFIIKRTSNELLTDVLIHKGARFQIQNSALTTQGRIINKGSIIMNQQAKWHVDNNFDNAIELQDGSSLEFSDSELFIGNAAIHSETDVLIESGASLTLNGGTISIVNALKNSGHLIVDNGTIQVGTYEGSASGNFDTCFDIQESGHFTLNNDDAKIEIKGASGKNNPGLYFHEQADIVINGGEIVFSNARQENQLFAIPNNHDLPLVTVDLTDVDHEVVFADSNHQMKELIINRGTLRLDNNIINFTGNNSPTIKIGNDEGDNDAKLLVENGSIQMNQNGSNLKAMEIQSDGIIEILSDGSLERQRSIEDSRSDVIYIKGGGAFYLNGGHVTLNNQQSQYGWGMTIDINGLFQMNGGIFNNDASVICHGTMQFYGGTFNLVSTTDKNVASFQIESNGHIEARDTTFDHFSKVSGLSGITIDSNASIGDSSGDDDLDFDGCTFKNWHLQGVALTVNNSESFTIVNPVFENSDGKSITTTTATIQVTGANLGSRGGEAFDAEFEGSTHNQINWPDTISLYGRENSAQALHPDNGTYSYYAANTQISVSGQTVEGHSSLLWEITPSGSSIPESGESSPSKITLLGNGSITWFSGEFGLWTGEKSSDWSDKANWDDHKIPKISTGVIIQGNCNHYPVLDESLSINGTEGTNQCKSIHLQQGATLTTLSTVYCYSLVHMTDASWFHSANQLDAFQVGANGQLLLDNSEIVIGHEAPLAGLTIKNEGQFLANNSSTVKISHGFYMESNASVDISNTDFSIGLGESLTDPIWTIAENAQLNLLNSTVNIKGCANIEEMSLHFHTHANISFENTPMYFAIKDQQYDTMRADFGSHTVNDIYIQMARDDQALKLDTNTVIADHLFIEKGIFENNGATLQITGNGTAIVIGNEASEMEARLKMTSGNIQITGQSPDICAMHIHHNGIFEMEDGTFSRNIFLEDSFDKVLLIEGIYNQKGGTFTVNNQHDNEHWNIWLDKKGTFKLSGGLFENDSRIRCSGLMDLDGGHIKVSSSKNETETGFDIFGKIQAQNTKFSRYSHSSATSGISVHPYATVGTSIGDDDDDFDLCQFEDWYINGYALSVSNGESFTIAHPVFTNSDGYNINADSNIYVTGLSFGNRGGEEFDCDKEGGTVNKIHWEDTRKLVGKNGTATALSPSMNETFYYGQNTVAKAEGQILTGTSIHWHIEPPESASPSEGDGNSASFTINEHAEIIWYSGFPGVWTGKDSSEWNHPGNWSDYEVPDHTIDVIIHANVPHSPIINEPLYVNSSEGRFQCRSLKLLNDATLTSTSQVIAYSGIEMIEANWFQETNENDALVLNNGASMNIIDASLMIGLPHINKQTCIKINNGGALKLESGLVTLSDRFHVGTEGVFQMSGGIMILGAESNALSTVTGMQPDTSGLFQVDADAHISILDGTVEIQTSWDQTQVLRFDSAAQVDSVKGEWIFISRGLGALKTYADFGEHEVYQVRLKMGQADHCLALSDHDAWFNELKIQKGQFQLNSQTLSFKGAGPSIIVGDQAGTNDATLLLKNGEFIQINQAVDDVKALLIQSDGQFLMSGGQLNRNVFVEDDFDYVIHITANGLYEQTGGEVVINNQSDDHYWGIWIDKQANFNLHGGSFFNDARTWCFGNMQVVDAIYKMASSENETKASFSLENEGNIQAKNASFYNMFSEKGILIKAGARIGQSVDDDDYDFDQCLFENWSHLGAAITVENTESFTMVHAVFNNNGGFNVNKQTAGQIWVTGQSSGSWGGEFHDSDIEGGMTNYIHWEDTVSLTGQSISGEAVHPGDQQTVYYMSGSEISASGKGYPLIWEVSPSESVSITAGEGTPAQFVLNNNATIQWYSIKPGMWRGTVSSDWHDPMNWDDNKIPSETQDVTIPYTYTNALIVTKPAVCANLTMKEASQLTIQSDLSIHGHLIMESSAQLNNGDATLEIYGDWHNDGIFNAQTGTVEFLGYSNCQILQNADAPMTFNRLIINKQTLAVLSFGAVSIQKEFILKTGVPHFTSSLEYASGARLTYASSQEQTTGTELNSPSLPSEIHINSDAGVYLSKDLSIKDALLFSKGYLVLGDYDLHIQEGAEVDGSFSHNTSIVTNGSGAYIAEINQPNTLFFPVGSINAASGFAPFTIVFHDGDFSNGQVRMQTVNDKPMENNSLSNYSDQYWEVASSGIINYTCTVMADLDNNNIQGESLYFGRWNGQNWYVLDPIHDQSPRFSGEVNAFGLFTGGEYNTFASRIILSGFMDHFCGVKAGGVSDEKSYAISGNNLLDDIIIKPPEQFEISTQSGSEFITFPQQLRLSPINSQIPETQIFVRFRPSGDESVQDVIIHSSENAMTQQVLASGSGVFIRTITLSAPTTSENLQIKLEFDPEIFEYDHVLDGGDDIRFKKGSQNLPYWIQQWDPEGTSIIWVRVLDADVSSFDMEYGEDIMPPVSNGEETFALYDDFSGTELDTEKWQTKNVNTMLSGGSLIVEMRNDSGGISSIQSFESTETCSYAAVYKASVNSNNYFTLFGFSEGTDPWVKRTGIYGYKPSTLFGKQSGATSTSHESNKSIALYDENISHLMTIALNQGYGFDDNYIEHEGDPVLTAHAAISTYELGGSATVDWMFVYKNATPQINATIGAECNMPGGGIWLGSISSDWSNPKNWNTGGTPKASDNVTIDANCPNMPRLTATSNCKNIEIKRNASLNLSNYQLNVYGEWKNNGTLIPQNGTVCFKGTIDVDASGLGPETQIVGNVSDTQKYEYLGYYYLGYKFKVTEDITVFSFRHYFGREVSLWSDRGSLLATVTTNKTGGQWSVLELSEPLTLTGNESYVLAAFTGGNPYYLSSEIESGFANGNIQESRYSSGQSFPDTLSSVQWWMVDLIYKTGSGTGFENFNQLIVQKTGDHYVELKNVHIENRLTMVSGNLLIKNMLTYSSDAALEYAIDTNYTTSHEFPAVEGPNNLIINGAGTVNLDFDRHIDGRLSLMNGKLQLGKNNLSLGPDASVKISGQDAFLVTDDTGKLRQHLDNTRTCIFPLGYTSFMPLTLDIHSAQLEDQAYIDVSLHDTSYSVSKPPESLSPLNRYWQIEQSGISDMSCDIHAVYADDNIPETANEKYFMGDYKDINDQWFSLGRVDLQGNLFEGNAIDPQIVTAYEYDLANHLPSGESKTISILENESYPFTASDFGFSDNDPYDTFKAIRITRLPQPGNLIYQTLNVENMQIFEVSALNQLTFKPGYDDSGLNYTSFEFQVQDSELGWSEASYTITFNVIRINKAPVMSLSGTIYRRVSEDLSPTSWSKPYISANDPDGDLLTWILVTPPEHGIAKVSGTGTEPSALQYTPDANYFGIDQWVFGVYDTAIEPLSDTIVVEVTVESVNDAPVFTCQQTQLTLDEDFVGAVDIEVIPVPVPENEKTEEVYYVIIPETNAIVHTVIDEHTGKLTLNAIENKSGNAYIDIVANDNQVLNSTARQTISITIVAVNDPPLFELDQTEISVNEDFTQTYVVNVIPESVPQNETSQSVHYYLSPSQIEFVNLSMDSDTGQLTITGIPDANGSGIVEIWADDTQSENNLVHRSLLINVEPVNDPPSFYLNMTQVRLVQDFEQTITITPYFEHIPVDEQSETHVFRLSPTVTYANVIIDPNTGIIKITSIDNETGNTTIVVTADDNQMEHNTATASFELNVLEKMPPLSIQVARDIVQLDEDFPQEEQVEVNLETDSEHPNRSASFSLSPTQIDCANLSIDPDTGTVTINNIPDQNGTQEITVLAVDNSDPMITATDTFILQIDSINDPPDFELSESIIQCQENQDQPIVIQILPAQTPQDEKGQSVTYSITPLDSDLLDISLNTLQKTIQIIPKLNQNGVSTFTVIARENASEFAESTQQFSVTVLDVNSPPKFTVIPQAIENQEDFETITLTVDAMIQPPDEQTQEVTYTISPESLDFVKLHIDEKSGQVTIESIKDLFGAATLTLTAHESPVDENADYSQQIDITILSVNDQPIFQINQTDIKLVEDFESTEIITITANTPPINEEDQIVTYRLSPKTIAFADISIDESNGTVSINSLKDLNGSATISIFADDHSDVNNQYSRSFNLEVSAVNDPPHFTLSQTAVSLYEDFSGSTTIYAHAMDPPLDESTQGISYKISPPQCDFAKVEIIPDSGEIHITSKPNQHGYQRIEVTANDMQAVNNTAVQYLDLTVISVNDPPLFSLSKTQIILDEDCPTPTIVDIIPDIQSADESEPVSYNLTPNSVDFVDIFVDSNAKKIQIRTIPDKIGYQDFTITADDHQSTNNNAKTTFVISVEPVNDPPVFSLQQTSVNLLEDFDAPFTMTVIKGAIPEDELNQEVSYEITPKESDLAAYEINATTGQLTITSLHNANGSQSLTIIANDHQSIRNTFAQSFKLNITPVNDTPTFRLDQNEVILDEDFSGIQTLPWEFIDVPEDELSQTVEFHLSPSTCDFADIQVDHNTEMRFQSIKDLNGSADFLLIADDQQSQNSQYSQPFRFVVRPVNDTPAFALSSDALTVVEDFEGDQTIEVIPLPAPSDETDDLIRYALSPAETPFAFVHINENDGKITFRSTQNEYGVQVFTVTANDYKDTNALYHQQLTLTVLPDNDPPVFTLSRSSVNVDEDFIGKQSIHVIPGLTPSNEYEQTTYSLNPSSVNFALIDIDPQSGLIEIQSLNNGNGSQMILVIADDGGDQNNTAAVSFSLNIEPINDPPIFQLSENILELTEDFTETQTIKCNLDPSPLDEQTQVVQFSYQTQPPNLVDIILNQKDGIMSIAPIPNANGTQIITVISNDGQRYQAQHEEELTIHIEAVNDLPYFSLSQTEISVAQNFTQTQWIEATPNAVPSDEIIQQVTYQLFPEKSSIVNASIDPFTGKIGLTAMTNQSGTQVYTVTASDGLAETSEFFTITVRRVSSIYVNFITTDDREGYAPFEVSFVAQVQGNVSRYEWQFGDGTSSTNANPKHVYNTPGIYTVRLTAFGADGSKTTEKANYIWIKSRKIMGKVLTNDSEMGLSEYTVEVWQEGTILKSTLTDLDGHYILDGLPKASQLIVSAWPPYGETTYFYQYYNQKDSVDHADKLSTEENDLTDINFLLERALDIGIQGCVYGISGDPDSGIQGIQVDVYSEITMFGMTALTDENGCYSFVHLKNAVDYRVSVWSETLLKDYYYVVPDASQIGQVNPMYSVSRWQKASLVEPTRPPVQKIDIILDKNANERGIIVGTVYRSDNVKLAGIRVNAKSEIVNDQNSALSDANGKYTISELTPVTEAENGYIVEIDTPNYPYQAFSRADLDTIPVRVVTGRTDIDFYLRTLRKISGTINSQCDEDIHARVVASSNSNTYEVHSDMNGNYAIDNLLPASNYTVAVFPENAPVVYYPDMDNSNEAVLLNLLNKNQTGIDFTVLPPSKLLKVIEGLQVLAGMRENSCYALDMDGDGTIGLRDVIYVLGRISK